MQLNQSNDSAAREEGQTINLIKSGHIGCWPVFFGFPIAPIPGRGVIVKVCTHWQCNSTATAMVAKKLESAIKEAVMVAIRGLESCSHTPDPDGMRAFALNELRAGRPAIVAHPVAVKCAAQQEVK